MTWIVYAYRHRKETVYSGPKKRPSIIREFDDEPSAHRYAKALIEEDKALVAEVRPCGT